MHTSWWKKEADLDDAQQKVILLPRDGRFLLTGPPGSGKTNLLLLRAKFLRSAGLKDVLFLTVGRTLQEFITTGIGPKGLISTDQIMTVRRWIMKLCGEHSPAFMKNPPQGNYEVTQRLYADELERVAATLPAIYGAILIDEVQDLTAQELRAIASLTPRIMVAGDDRQRINSSGEGIEASIALGFESIVLHYHYRIGKRICEAADSVLPPLKGTPSLAQRCNYDDAAMPSTCRLVEAVTLELQLQAALVEIRVQLKAYPKEPIGIFVPRRTLIDELKPWLEASTLAPLCAFHDEGGSREFAEGKQIFVMTINSAKGTEFRAVHILGAEKMRRSGGRRLVFTAFTRAKTSLAVYHSGEIVGFIEGAFAQPTTPSLSELF